MAPPRIDFLSKYLINERANVYKEWFHTGVIGDENLNEENFRLEYKEYYTNGRFYAIKWDVIDDDASFWKGDKLPWNGLTCLTVLHYVMKLTIYQKMHDAIQDLNNLAIIYRQAKRLNLEEEISQQIKGKFCHLFVNFFMPLARRECFRVPNLNEVLFRNNSLKENELLASSLDFLLQILNSEEHEKHKYNLLQKDLTFLLSVLGDLPFRYTEHEDVRKILGGIRTLANKAGNYIYSCVFTLYPDNHETNHNSKKESISETEKQADQQTKQQSIWEMVEILNKNIKEYCLKYSKQNSTVISLTNNVMDSVFIVDSLIEDLENMMNTQFHLIADELKVEIRNLHEELMISRSLLNDNGRPKDRIHMDELNESTAQVRDVAYEAEYLVNSYAVGNLPLWYFQFRLPVVISKFKLMRTRLQETKIIIKKDFGREVSTQTKGTPTIKIIDIVVIGFEAETAKISEDLCGRGKDRQIVSIFGMPGIGKTTIANKLFNNRLIIDHFDQRGRCVVSQAYERRKVLIEILESLSKSNIEKKNLPELDDEELSVKIHQCLYNRQYLIYLDDVWTSDVWDDLQRFFPDQGNGSRILLTSRIRGISPTNSIVHSLTLLTEEQSWSLLEMKMFPKKTCPPELQSIGKRIAAKCGGLPLTIVVTAGVMVNLENEESKWEKVEKNLDSYIFSIGTDEYYSKILELSFNHLPNHLKMCFLYVGAFREDEEIPVRKLIQLWISEGFIQREQDQKSLELVAAEYLKDLIDRSLLLIARRKSDGRIKACRIHDQLRTMCLRKSHESLFSKSVHYQNYSIYDKTQRMFDNFRSPAVGRPFGLYYRSFSGCLPHPSSRLPQMKLLRVMDLIERDPDSTSHELENVDLLVQLRYLSLNKMPKPIHGNFVNLEFLVINSSEIVYIPLVILTSVKLRHLHIKKGAIFEKDCYNCHSIIRLRFFSGINIVNNKENEILRCSPHLVKIKCYYWNPTLFPDLHSHPHLQILSLQYHCYFSGECTMVSFPSTITNLSLMDLGFPWEKISIIGKLPKLRVLKLFYHAFVGEQWETREGEFQELMFLRISGNDLIKEWITCSDHFPQLECLEVIGCINLEEIPSEIGDIPTLQMIKVLNCGKEARESAVKIVEEQRENGNEGLQLETRNDLTMESMVQFYQKRNLEMQEYRSNCIFTEEGTFRAARIEEIETEDDKMAEKWPKKVNKEVHQHELVLTKHNIPYYRCDGCSEDGRSWSYYCKDCDFDLHPRCALDEEDYHNGKKGEDEEKKDL